MIHKNVAARDCQFLMSMTATAGGPATNGQYDAVSFEGILTETWGLSYSPGVTGIQASILKINATGGWQSVVSVATPWGSYTPSAVLGAISSGAIRILMAGAQLTVRSDCTFTLTFTSLTVYVTIGGGSEATVMTVGPQSVSGSGYDERQNATTLTPNMPIGLPGPLSCSTTTFGSATDSVSVSGGYEYFSGGAWTADSVGFDGSSTGGTCSCLTALPSITGLNSGNVTVGSQVSSSVTSTSISGDCPGCIPEDWTGFQITADSTLTTSSVTVKDANTSVGSQNVATSWACALSPGGDTSGSGSTTSTPGSTTCASNRSAERYVNQTDRCYNPPVPECEVGFTCPGPFGYGCIYVGNATLSWPTLPPCGSTPVSAEPLGYDVSNGLRHVITYRNATSGHIWLACAGNEIPQTWSPVDTGLSAVWARPRFADLGSGWPIGLFYGDGTDCFWARSYDEGRTWVDTTAMGTAMTGDFDEGANGLRWLFKVDTPDGGATYAVYRRLLDSQLNLVQDWTMTNLTGIDNQPIACRESHGSDGSWRIGVLYSVGGAETLKFAPDGIHFT